MAVAWISGRGSKLNRDSRIDCHSVSGVGQFLTLSDDTRSCFTRKCQVYFQGRRFTSVQRLETRIADCIVMGRGVEEEWKGIGNWEWDDLHEVT